MRRLVQILVFVLAGLALGPAARAESTSGRNVHRALLQPTADWYASRSRLSGWEALFDPYALLEPTMNWYALLQPTGRWYRSALAVVPRHTRRPQVIVKVSQITVRASR
jgi:hypothetical protein